MSQSRDLEALLASCASGDRHRLRQRLRTLRRRGGDADALGQWHAAVERSQAKVAARRERVPTIDYPQHLPVVSRRDDIAAAIAAHQVVVIAGETGSGKTTQLPKICLELGRGVHGLIGHTQPRRIAARTVANRLAEELHTTLGDTVGYQVRFTEQTSEHTLVKVMTDGILLAEIQRDRFLSRYDTLIIDEAHERSLNIDFLLGYLKQLLPRRPDLKVIITSATIDVEKFSRHFDGAPIIEVSGRTWPVEVWYRPPEPDTDAADAIVNAVEELLALPQRGDILVFLSGEREIRETSLALRRRQLPHVEVLPLYARLSLADQSRVFAPHRGTRIVLATNVAETSITVPGIRYVVDTGLARISRYSHRTKVQRLPVEPISQASANQRAGRCGRVAEGVCIRLYDEADFQRRPEFTDPEILRTNLAAVILQMLGLRMGAIERFPFVDPPDSRMIRDGYRLLEELQAVDSEGRLTAIGEGLRRLPVDPRLGRMLLAAEQEGALRELVVLVAVLSIQDPRERPADKQQAADEKHRAWRDAQSDLVSLLNLWQGMEEQRQALSRNQFTQWCRRQFLSPLRVREWRDLEHQLKLLCREAKLRFNREPASYDNIHRALLTGLLDHIGFRHEEREFLGTRNRKFHIFPGSGLFKKPPKWLMAVELLETTRLYAHTVARIEPEWVQTLAAHLVNRNYSEPHYDPRRGQVMAWERQTLYGLTVLERKRVAYAPIDPVVAREVFIRSALVEGRYRGPGAFFTANRELLADIRDLEARHRRRDLLLDEEEIYIFFDERLPDNICSLAGFEKWRKKTEQTQPRLLYFEREWLLQRLVAPDAEAQFPDTLSWAGITWRLSYRFEPGHGEDGVNVDVPIGLLHQVPAHRFEWVVPGLLRDKCIAMIKALPKQLRKQLVPVPDYVDRLLPRLQPADEPLGTALGRELKRLTALDIPEDAWDEGALELFYRVYFRLLDEHGKAIAGDRDLAGLKQTYRGRVQETLREAAPDAFERSGIITWDFGELPPSTRLQRQGVELTAYPALVEGKADLELRLLDNPHEALWQTRQGLVRLFMLHIPQVLKALRGDLLGGLDLQLNAAGLPQRAVVTENLLRGACEKALLWQGDGWRPVPRSDAEFAARVKEATPEVTARAREYAQWLAGWLPDLIAIRKLLKKQPLNAMRSVGDVRGQLERLFNPELFTLHADTWLQQYDRYLKGILLRLEKLPGFPQKDAVLLYDYEAMQERCDNIWERRQRLPEEGFHILLEGRFLLEELRVSLFAQQLKTVQPVSIKRLKKWWEEHEVALRGE